MMPAFQSRVNTLPGMKTAPGFSLIECLVAALVLATGLLAASASLTAAQRLGQLGRHTAGAAEAAASRLALLRATACAAPAGGSAAARYDERWSVVAAGDLRTLSVDVTFQHDHRARTIHFDGTLRCPAP